jgi:hypothetical protein
MFVAVVWTAAAGAGSAPAAATDPPPAPTTLTVTMTDAAKISGLSAGQTVTIANVGSNPALNVKLGVIIGEGTVLKSFDTTAGTCTNSNPIVVVCSPGTLAAGTTFTVRLILHLPVHPPSNDVIAQVRADNSPFVSANARPYFRNRFWPCVCASATYANGWTVPGASPGYTVDADDTVHLTGGYVITPDGVLHYPDGRTIVVDAAGNYTFVPKPTTGSSNPPKGSQSTLQLVSSLKILGIPVVGNTLRLQGGVWTRRPDRVEFQWQSCSANGRCGAVANRSSTLALSTALAGKRVRVTETAWFGGTRRQLASRGVLVRTR